MSDPRRRHPGHEPSERVPTILGVRVPPPGIVPRIIESIPPSVRHPSKASKGVKAGLASGAILTLVAVLWQGLPPIIAALKSDATPRDPVGEQCATQSSLDAMSARLHTLEQRLEKQGEVICELNQGAALTDWPCDRSDYYAPHKPPPLVKSDRSYPK